MKKTTGVIFSGYGEQFVTMGKNLYDASRDVQDLFEQASMCLDINFVQLCFASSDQEISDIQKGYLAVLLLQVSLYSQLAQAGLRPDFIAGFGIGEYAAAVACGSLTFSDALYLLNKYALFFKEFVLQERKFGVIYLSRGFHAAEIQELCQTLSVDGKQIFVAAHVTEEGFFVAGDIDLIDYIQKYCKDNAIRKVKLLTPGHGLHSLLTDSVVALLAPYFFKIDFLPLQYPVITNVDAVYVTSPDALESAIRRKFNNPILWDEVMNGFVGCDVLICVGPGDQIAQWAALKYPEKIIYQINDLADLEKLQPFLQEHGAVMQEQIEDNGFGQKIIFGTCHVDEEVQLPVDLTIADEINELPDDYDIDEDEEHEIE